MKKKRLLGRQTDPANEVARRHGERADPLAVKTKPVAIKPQSVSMDAVAHAAAMAKLLKQVQTMLQQSGAPEHMKQFNAAQWLDNWIIAPLPALAGRRPADLHGYCGRAGVDVAAVVDDAGRNIRVISVCSTCIEREGMKLRIDQWGNGLAVRLPSWLLNKLHVRPGDKLDVRICRHGLLLTRARPRYLLADLVALCDPAAPEPTDIAEWRDL